MNTKTYKAFYESVIDLVRKTFSTQLFDNANTDSPKLKSKVRRQIIDGMQPFRTFGKIKSYSLIGSSLTRQYKDDADLDVNVEIDIPDIDGTWEAIKPTLWATLRKVNGQVVPGTRHPINYHLLFTPEENQSALDHADAVFDIDNNKWIKFPPAPSYVDIAPYLKRFDTTLQHFDVLKNRFERVLHDYHEYKGLGHDTVIPLHNAMVERLSALETLINALIDAEEDVATKRRATFARSLTREELELYGTHNRLPENILYKILERYHYLDFIQHLKDVIGDDRKLTELEADQL